MRPPHRPVLLVILFLAGVSAGEGEIEKLRKDSASGGTFREPDGEELDASRRLFIRSFKSDVVSDDLRLEWRDIGFRVIEGSRCEDRWILVAEVESRREGRGLFAVRTGERLSVLVQSPHSFHDLHTGEIASYMFEGSSFAAAAWNTVPRYSGDGKGGTSADVAHRDSSFFMEFLKAFDTCHPKGTVIQVHGFDPAKRKSRAGRSAGVILSDGSRFPDRRLSNRRGCLRGLLDRSVYIYPLDVVELGGTTNRQGAWLRERGESLFIHLEMNPSVRRWLRQEEERCARVGLCVSGY